MKDTISSLQMTPRTERVLLIYTGGTIGMGRNPVTGVLEPLDFNHLVSCLPEFATLETGIDTYQFTPPIDSSDWTQQYHYGAIRDNNSLMYDKLGADTGFDSIGEFTTATAMSHFLN